METPVFTITDPTEGMPSHPYLTDHPVLWADLGDRWLFRRTTNVLVPKLVDVVNLSDPLVRYTACAIKRALGNGGGIDFVIWQELEEIQPDKRTSVVVPVLCFGPSRFEHIDDVKNTVNTAMIAFAEVYKNPMWISQYEGEENVNTEHPSV